MARGRMRFSVPRWQRSGKKQAPAPTSPGLQWFEFMDVTHGPDEGFKCPKCGNYPCESLYIIAEDSKRAWERQEEAMCHSCSGAPDSFLSYMGYEKKPKPIQWSYRADEARKEIENNEW